ncbi:flagellar basal body-associated FliL family protein [Propylenella binzhouense]|nr:flagellar basal body-associated FliL family protein [Propylenella binzhouense]
MAPKALPAPAGRETRKGPGPGASIGAVAVLTLLAGAAGGLFGLRLPAWTAPADEAAAPAGAGPAAEHGSGDARPSNIHPLPPVITNLGDPATTSVRLEASLVFKDPAAPLPDDVANAIAGDILAYLRTVSLEDIEGASGLQHLREDLADRAAIRADGAVRELVILTLVVQ